MSPHFVQDAVSLDERRPRFLRELIGNEPVLNRFRVQMRNNRMPRRVFLYGPSGSGKTTLATILLRRFFCAKPAESGEACGVCDTCRYPDIKSHWNCEGWLGAHLDKDWNSWIRDTGSFLWSPSFAYFIDEVQDLRKSYQKELFDRLEGAEAMVIFATTHKHKLEDALVNRFGVNVYEMQRPKPQQAVELMMDLCDELGVRATADRLLAVAVHYGCDVRKCVDFVYTAVDQTEGGFVSDAFMDDVLGPERASRNEWEAKVDRGPKL